MGDGDTIEIVIGQVEGFEGGNAVRGGFERLELVVAWKNQLTSGNGIVWSY